MLLLDMCPPFGRKRGKWGMTRMWDVRLATIQDLTLAFADSPMCLGF